MTPRLKDVPLRANRSRSRKKIGIRLGRAARIANDHARHDQSRPAPCSSPCDDRRRCRSRRRATAGVIFSPSARSSTSAPNLRSSTARARNAVGLLVANVGDVADRGRPIGEQGHGGQRLHRVADGVHVDFDAAQRPARDGDAGRPRTRTSQPICCRQSQKATSPCRLSRTGPRRSLVLR